MRRSVVGTAGLLLGMGLWLTGTPAPAVITMPLSLNKMLAASAHVCVARVEQLDPERPAMVLAVEADLKGKLPVRRLPVSLKANREGQKLNHTPQLLKRLAVGLPVVLLFEPRGEGYDVFGYTNGTWFRCLGQKDKDALRWRFLSAEPYLRRSFKGTTAEMRKVVEDVLSGKGKAPEVDDAVEPGFGPELKPGDKTGAVRRSGPLFGVIPTVGLGAPLAVLAMLFPTVFGGVMLLLRRWKALLAVVCTNSTLFTLHFMLKPHVRGAWWNTSGALWTAMTAVTLLGSIWAWRRERLAPQEAGAGLPTRAERWVLGVLSLAGLAGVLAYLTWSSPSLYDPGWKLLLVISAGFWAGTLYALALTLRGPGRTGRPLPTEGVILWVMVGACAFLTTGGASGSLEGPRDLDAAGAGAGQRGAVLRRQVWQFTPAGPSDVAASPVVAGDRVYLGVIHGGVFRKSGAVYCLDRETGKELWRFDNDGDMKQMFSSPCVAGGRVYIGEGFHENAGCLLYCLDAATGKKLWEFETNSHTESTPCVAGGKVYFGAGDDGLYCVDAATGAKVWQYPGPQAREGLHVDASPVVVGGRVYCGSGVSRTHRKLQVFCLDAATGAPAWAMGAIDLPAWGSPAVAGGHVYFGLGNGRLTLSDEKDPRGAILCVDAKTGQRVWRFDGVKDGIHARPAVGPHHVCAACRDGHCYCLDRQSGRLVWKRDLGSPSVSAPAPARCSACGGVTSLYVAATKGDVFCLDPRTGAVLWRHDELSRGGPMKQGLGATLLSSLVVESQRGEDGDRRRIYFAAGVNSGNNSLVACLEDEFRGGHRADE